MAAADLFYSGSMDIGQWWVIRSHQITTAMCLGADNIPAEIGDIGTISFLESEAQFQCPSRRDVQQFRRSITSLGHCHRLDKLLSYCKLHLHYNLRE